MIQRRPARPAGAAVGTLVLAAALAACGGLPVKDYGNRAAPAAEVSGAARAAQATSPTSPAGIDWPAGVPFPAGQVLARFSDPTDWSATVLVAGTRAVAHDRLLADYRRAGFTLVSDGLPAVLTRGRYTVRVQVSPRDHRDPESLVTLQLSRA